MSAFSGAPGPPDTAHLWGLDDYDQTYDGPGSAPVWSRWTEEEKQAYIAEQRGTPEQDFDPVS